MSFSGTEIMAAVAQGIAVSDDALIVDLTDGRTITVPSVWFPRLAHGTPAEPACRTGHFRATRSTPNPS